MDHEFVTVGHKRRGIARFEHPLGHPRQRIGAAHGARRSADERPTWDVGEKYLGVFPPNGMVASNGDYKLPGPMPMPADSRVCGE